MRFTKMQGIGNDYVYVNAFKENIESPERLAVRIADRHFGVGADGLILVAPPTPAGHTHGAHVRMRMFNADGSEAEMCGNGLRCVAKYAFDHGLSTANPMRVETGNGVMSLALEVAAGKVTAATVNMGQPILDLPRIPVLAEKLAGALNKHEYRLSVPGDAASFAASFVSMGNPHAIIYCHDVQAVDLAKIGPPLERHEAFPRRINVHFVRVHSPAEVTMRTWERGSGITLACGTGASAVCVAGVLTARTDRNILAHLPGGDLQLEWRKSDNCVYMTGPAVEVFEGQIGS